MPQFKIIKTWIMSADSEEALREVIDENCEIEEIKENEMGEI